MHCCEHANSKFRKMESIQMDWMDILRHPHNTVERIFCSVDDNCEKSAVAEEIVFSDLLSSNVVYCKIPELSSNSIGALDPNTLCRYRGIVQDVFDVEYYCALFNERNNQSKIYCKYRDVLPTNVAVDFENPLQMMARLALIIDLYPSHVLNPFHNCNCVKICLDFQSCAHQFLVNPIGCKNAANHLLRIMGLE